MIVHERYRVLDEFSEGGQGKLFIVFDEQEKNHQILKRHKDRPGLLKYLQKQVGNCRKLNHPQVLVPHTLVQIDPVCTVAPFVKGMNLWDWAKKKRGLSFQEAGVFLAQLAGILDYLHKIRVVHRDLKPSNILIDQREILYLLDFDAACFQNSKIHHRIALTKSFRLMGTSQYMAPEHMRASSPHQAMDLYSTATTFYQIMTLRFPFGESLEDREDLKHFKPVNFLTKRQNNVLRKALSPDPKQRHSSTLEFYKEMYKV
jgi:serine/threonine-protein kinase